MSAAMMRKIVKNRVNRKTRICMVYENYYNEGKFTQCDINKCNYAHGSCDYEDSVPQCLREYCRNHMCKYRHLPKTIICINVIRGDICDTEMCQYAHSSNDYSKNIKLCPKKEKCIKKDKCKFRHFNRKQCLKELCKGRNSCRFIHLPKTFLCKFIVNNGRCITEKCEDAHGSIDYDESVPRCTANFNNNCKGFLCEYRHDNNYSSEILDLSKCPYSPNIEELYLTRFNLKDNMMMKYRLSTLIRLIFVRDGYILDQYIAENIASYVFKMENFDLYYIHYVYSGSGIGTWGYLVKYLTQRKHTIYRWPTIGELLSLYENTDNLNGMYLIRANNSHYARHLQFGS
jgi:hypothetical protein